MERTIRMYTGVGGYNLFQETMEEKALWTKRIYLGRKIPRILRKMKSPIHKSVDGRFFRRVKKINLETAKKCRTFV